jgi:hypothetical protein
MQRRFRRLLVSIRSSRSWGTGNLPVVNESARLLRHGRPVLFLNPRVASLRQLKHPCDWPSQGPHPSDHIRVGAGLDKHRGLRKIRRTPC